MSSTNAQDTQRTQGKAMKTKPITQKTAWALATAGALTLSGPVSAQTQYERQNQGPRLAPWEQPDTNVRRQSTGSPSIESSNLSIDAEALTSSYERIRQNPGWVAVEDQVDDQTDRIGDLEDLLDQMEIASTWQEEPPEVSAWVSGSNASSAIWEPAIENQTADFTQTRQVTNELSRTVKIYESNAATGERQLKDSYIETQTVNETQSRVIDVANNPGGGTDGWSDWRDTSGGFGLCFASFTPSTTAVDYRQTFTQTRDCSTTFERSIYYLSGGEVIHTNNETQTNEDTQTRIAQGRKVPGECRYNNGADPDQRIQVQFYVWKGAPGGDFTRITWKWRTQSQVQTIRRAMSHDEWISSYPSITMGGRTYLAHIHNVRHATGDVNGSLAGQRWHELCQQ